MLYAHHRKLDYFSTECIYSPEAFRGSARSLIKSLERVRPSAILDIVRSGEAFAEMVPQEIRGLACAGEKGVGGGGGGGGGGGAKTTAAEEEDGGGCAKGTTTGDDPSLGGEMSKFEKQLEANEKAESLETEVTLPVPAPAAAVQVRTKKTKKGKEKKEGPAPGTRKQQQQQLGSCRKCGYMSSQELCKACVILDGLNKNRPQISIELDGEEEEVSSSVRRKMEALDLGKSMSI